MLLVSISILFVIAIVAVFWLVTRDKDVEDADIPYTQETAKKGSDISAIFMVDTDPWEVGTLKMVDLIFDTEPDPFPTAVSLELQYDPEHLELDNIIEGDLWSKAFVLESKIDNETGMAKVTFGQEFSSERTGGTKVATFVFLPKMEGVGGSIRLLDDSVVSWVDNYFLISPTELEYSLE